MDLDLNLIEGIKTVVEDFVKDYSLNFNIFQNFKITKEVVYEIVVDFIERIENVKQDKNVELLI